MKIYCGVKIQTLEMFTVWMWLDLLYMSELDAAIGNGMLTLRR